MTVLDDPVDVWVEKVCAVSLEAWTERKRHLVNEGFHNEWCHLAQTESRLALMAPRDHSKSETFVVNQIAWRSTYRPGWWSYVFSETGDQSGKLLDRIDEALMETCPALVVNAVVNNRYERVYANGSTVSGAGASKSVRGAHPDLIVGDDVLSEENTLTSAARKALKQWWFGTVGGMAHPGTRRRVGNVVRVFPPTTIQLVGTPMHNQDLLMEMRTNLVYRTVRYAAEYDPAALVAESWALEDNRR